jgi:hypothetical protein
MVQKPGTPFLPVEPRPGMARPKERNRPGQKIWMIPPNASRTARCSKITCQIAAAQIRRRAFCADVISNFCKSAVYRTYDSQRLARLLQTGKQGSVPSSSRLSLTCPVRDPHQVDRVGRSGRQDVSRLGASGCHCTFLCALSDPKMACTSANVMAAELQLRPLN